jgi:hypothetical protein
LDSAAPVATPSERPVGEDAGAPRGGEAAEKPRARGGVSVEGVGRTPRAAKKSQMSKFRPKRAQDSAVFSFYACGPRTRKKPRW